MPPKKRKYSGSYVAYGFTSETTEGFERPQCYLCGKILCNANMKPSKLKKHFAVFHKERASDCMESLSVLKDVFEKGKKSNNTCTEKALLKASYKVAYEIAKNKYPHLYWRKISKTVRVSNGRTSLWGCGEE